MDKFQRYLEIKELQNKIFLEIGTSQVIDCYYVSDPEYPGQYYFLVLDVSENIVFEMDTYATGSWNTTMYTYCLNDKRCRIQSHDLVSLGYATYADWIADRFPNYWYGTPYTWWEKTHYYYEDITATNLLNNQMGSLAGFLRLLGWIHIDMELKHENFVLPINTSVSEEMEMIPIRQLIVPKTNVRIDIESQFEFVILATPSLKDNLISNSIYAISFERGAVPEIFRFWDGSVFHPVEIHYMGQNEVPSNDVVWLDEIIPVGQGDQPTSSEMFWPFDPEIATGYFGNVGWFVPATFRFWGITLDMYKEFGVLVGSVDDTLIRKGIQNSFNTISRTPVVLMYPAPAFDRTDVLTEGIAQRYKDPVKLHWQIKTKLAVYARQFLAVDIQKIAYFDGNTFMTLNAFESGSGLNKDVTFQRYYNSVMEFANDSRNQLLESWVTRGITYIALSSIARHAFRLAGKVYMAPPASQQIMDMYI